VTKKFDSFSYFDFKNAEYSNIDKFFLSFMSVDTFAQCNVNDSVSVFNDALVQ